ncbi:cyanogenic beta-glucosidase-like [Hevea brasiliensis]|uniref:cyanogenic beta-glucosidase-like n=1 Tax=Hevea brasiliensis TaxID=3981 RepID=UPI0025F899A7|nr:cyanogenic beta-glucosidase-like [Hevea brasiliensis]
MVSAFKVPNHAWSMIEGEANKSGRGPSVWDAFTHKIPERILDHNNGDIAVDFYHCFQVEGDVKETTFLSAIFSKQNNKHLVLENSNKYNNNILSSGLKHFVMIFHWDTPQALEDKYGGILNSNIVNDYRDYADLLFETFGDQVQYWMTFNEPWALSEFAYDDGLIAPAVQERQSGQIGIALVSLWFEPLSNRTIDIEASKTTLNFMFGLWMNPLFYGRYPGRVRDLVGNKLLTFTDEETNLL